MFLGYAHNSIAYRFLVVKFDTPEQNVNTIMESRYASFFEDIFPMKAAGSTSQRENIFTHEHSLENYTQPEPNDEKSEDEHLVDDAPQRSKRPEIAKFFGDDFIVYLVDDVPNTLPEAYASHVLSIGKRQSVVRWTP